MPMAATTAVSTLSRFTLLSSSNSLERYPTKIPNFSSLSPLYNHHHCPQRNGSLRYTNRFQVLCQTAGAPPKEVSAAKVGQGRLLKVPISNIRNFCIIAHIDHGKSSFADKLIETTGTVQKREMKEQFLDNMDLERERGITIKLQAARMRYVHIDEPYCLNLIDTPGHVDFSFEVLNKIDFPGAEPDRVSQEIEEVVGLDCSNAIRCSAKEGIGITEILDAIVERISPPHDTASRSLRALI